MPDQAAWPFLIGRSRKEDYRFVVLPELVHDPSVIAALRAGTGGDPGRPGTALVREIETPANRAGAVTAVYRVLEALGEDYGIPGGGLLTDAYGRPILLTEGLVIGGSASAVMASGLTQTALDLTHELVAPAFRRFWTEESGFTREAGRRFAVPATRSRADLLTLRLAGPAMEPALAVPAIATTSAATATQPQPLPASSASATPRRRGRLAYVLGSVVLLALVAAGVILLLARVLPAHGPSPSPSQTMTDLCDDLLADHPADAYALTAAAYRAKVTEPKFTSAMLPHGSAPATCTYHLQNTTGSTARAAMTVAQGKTPTAWTVALAARSGSAWQVTGISGDKNS